MMIVSINRWYCIVLMGFSIIAGLSIGLLIFLGAGAAVVVLVVVMSLVCSCLRRSSTGIRALIMGNWGKLVSSIIYNC